MASPTNNEKLLMYLDQAMRGATQSDKDTLAKVISTIFGNTETREMYDTLAKNFNPLKGINMTSYMPMKSTKKVFNKETGKHEIQNLTPQEMIQNTNTKINLGNIIGDVFAGLGGVANAKNQALSRVFQNLADTRSSREREIYGANSRDSAAAVGAPAAQALGAIEQLVTGLVANRLYGNAALRRQAEMQAIMDAYNRNVGGTGLFFDARRKSGENLIPTEQ